MDVRERIKITVCRTDTYCSYDGGVREIKYTVCRIALDTMQKAGCPIILFSRTFSYGYLYDDYMKGNENEEIKFKFLNIKSTLSLSIENYFSAGYTGMGISFIYVRSTVISNYLLLFLK